MFLCYLWLVLLMLSRLFVTCWERADFLTSVGDVYCIVVTFQCGILGQVWYLIASFSELCHLSYFYNMSLFGHYLGRTLLALITSCHHCRSPSPLTNSRRSLISRVIGIICRIINFLSKHFIFE